MCAAGWCIGTSRALRASLKGGFGLATEDMIYSYFKRNKAKRSAKQLPSDGVNDLPGGVTAFKSQAVEEKSCSGHMLTASCGRQ